MSATVGIVDYGMGNRRSVEKALERVGARVLLTGDHDALEAADGLVVPGVGAFPAAMERLRASGLDELVIRRAQAGTPVLRLPAPVPSRPSVRRTSVSPVWRAISAVRLIGRDSPASASRPRAG